MISSNTKAFHNCKNFDFSLNHEIFGLGLGGERIRKLIWRSFDFLTLPWWTSSMARITKIRTTRHFSKMGTPIHCHLPEWFCSCFQRRNKHLEWVLCKGLVASEENAAKLLSFRWSLIFLEIYVEDYYLIYFLFWCQVTG